MSKLEKIKNNSLDKISPVKITFEPDLSIKILDTTDNSKIFVGEADNSVEITIIVEEIEITLDDIDQDITKVETKITAVQHEIEQAEIFASIKIDNEISISIQELNTIEIKIINLEQLLTSIKDLPQAEKDKLSAIIYALRQKVKKIKEEALRVDITIIEKKKKKVKTPEIKVTLENVDFSKLSTKDIVGFFKNYEVLKREIVKLGGNESYPNCNKVEISSKALEKIVKFSREQGSPKENGGVLLGKVDERTGKIIVADFVSVEQKNENEYKKTQFRFKPDDWASIWNTIDTYNDGKPKSEELLMVGWFHTHPGLNTFLSSQDRYIQNGFFKRSYQLAMVCDPDTGQLSTWYSQKSLTKEELENLESIHEIYEKEKENPLVPVPVTTIIGETNRDAVRFLKNGKRAEGTNSSPIDISINVDEI